MPKMVDLDVYGRTKNTQVNILLLHEENCLAMDNLTISDAYIFFPILYNGYIM